MGDSSTIPILISGNYTINLTVKDNDDATNTATTYALIIQQEQQPPVHNETTNQSSILYVSDLGYLIDLTSDGIYELFYSNVTGNQTLTQQQNDGTYLIDANGDGTNDYTFNVTTQVITELHAQTNKGIPGFEFIIVLLVFLIFVIARRRKTQ